MKDSKGKLITVGCMVYLQYSAFFIEKNKRYKVLKVDSSWVTIETPESEVGVSLVRPNSTTIDE